MHLFCLILEVSAATHNSFSPLEVLRDIHTVIEGCCVIRVVGSVLCGGGGCGDSVLPEGLVWTVVLVGNGGGVWFLMFGG